MVAARRAEDGSRHSEIWAAPVARRLVMGEVQAKEATPTHTVMTMMTTKTTTKGIGVRTGTQVANAGTYAFHLQHPRFGWQRG